MLWMAATLANDRNLRSQKNSIGLISSQKLMEILKSDYFFNFSLGISTDIFKKLPSVGSGTPTSHYNLSILYSLFYTKIKNCDSRKNKIHSEKWLSCIFWIACQIFLNFICIFLKIYPSFRTLSNSKFSDNSQEIYAPNIIFQKKSIIFQCYFQRNIVYSYWLLSE